MSDRVQLPREIYVLVAAAVAVSLGFGIVAPVIPQYAKSFDVSTTAASIVVSAFAFMRLVFAPASGRLSGAFGERRMYMVGVFLVALSSFTSAMAQNYWQLLIFRGLGGIGSVTFTVAAMSIVFRLAPPKARGRASAAYGGGFLVGNILGPAIGALLAPLGYRWPFVIYGVFLLISLMIVGRLIPADVTQQVNRREIERLEEREKAGAAAPKPGEPAPGEKPTKPSKPQRLPRAPMTVREAMKNKRFRFVLFTAFSQGWTNMGVRVAIIPLLAASIVGGPTWLPGGMMTAFAAGTAIALIRAGRWSDIFGRRVMIIIGLLLSGLFTVGLGHWHDPWFLLGSSLLAGFGSGFVMPSQQGAVADLVGTREAGRIVSFFQMHGDMGQILGPVIAGALVDWSGFGMAYGASGGLLIGCALLWLFFEKGK